MPGITRSIQFALGKLDHEVPDSGDLVWCIGPPLLQSLEKMLGNPQRAITALELYRERFSATGLYENRLYPGIMDTLASLAEAGRPLFIATSKPTVYARRIVDHFSIGEYFEDVFGSGLDGTNSDKTDLLKHALEKTGADPLQATMVGDRSHDMIGARRNKMSAVGVLYGYGGEDELRAAGAQRLSPTTRELAKILS